MQCSQVVGGAVPKLFRAPGCLWACKLSFAWGCGEWCSLYQLRKASHSLDAQGIACVEVCPACGPTSQQLWAITKHGHTHKCGRLVQRNLAPLPLGAALYPGPHCRSDAAAHSQLRHSQLRSQRQSLRWHGVPTALPLAYTWSFPHWKGHPQAQAHTQDKKHLCVCVPPAGGACGLGMRVAVEPATAASTTLLPSSVCSPVEVVIPAHGRTGCTMAKGAGSQGRAYI